MKVKKICENCGKEYWVYPCRKDEAKRCSMKCRKRENRICKICGQEYIVMPSSRKQTCGNKKCRHRLIGEKNKKPLILKNCDYCGSKINKWPSHAKINKWHFCSRSCYRKWLSEKKVKIGKIVKCTICKKEIYKYPYQLKIHKMKGLKNHYCSERCFGKGQEKKIHKKCKGCGGLFLAPPKGNRRYCTDRCRRKSKGLIFLEGIIVKCENCGKQAYKMPYQRKYKTHFCNKLCHNEHMHKSRFYPDETCRMGAKILKLSRKEIERHKLMPIIELKALQIRLRREARKHAN